MATSNWASALSKSVQGVRNEHLMEAPPDVSSFANCAVLEYSIANNFDGAHVLVHDPGDALLA